MSARPVAFTALSVVVLEDGSALVQLHSGKPGEPQGERVCYRGGTLDVVGRSIAEAAADLGASVERQVGEVVDPRGALAVLREKAARIDATLSGAQRLTPWERVCSLCSNRRQVLDKGVDERVIRCPRCRPRN